jgi:hypothetical protein
MARNVFGSAVRDSVQLVSVGRHHRGTRDNWPGGDGSRCDGGQGLVIHVAAQRVAFQGHREQLPVILPVHDVVDEQPPAVGHAKTQQPPILRVAQKNVARVIRVCAENAERIRPRKIRILRNNCLRPAHFTEIK